MARKPQQQHTEAVRKQIIAIAQRIITKEGVNALSIRRITTEMGYSAGIVYHYFQNKEQLLACVLEQGYARIMACARPLDETLPPDEAIRAAFTGYVENGHKNSAEYRALMFSTSPQVLGFTSVLGDGKCEARPALQLLMGTLNAGIQQGLFGPCDPALTAQAIWAAMFGLLARLLIEKDVSPAQRAKLINRQIELILKGLRP